MAGMRLFPAAALLALLASGCGHAPRVPPPAPLPVERPRLGLERARVESLGFTGLDLAFDVRLENPNPTPLSVLRVSYALSLEGRRAAGGTIEAPLAVGAATAEPVLAEPGAPPAPPVVTPGQASLPLPVKVRYADVPTFAPLLQLDREAAYAFTGEVVFATPGGPLAVPLRQEGQVALPRAPRFRVARAALVKATPAEMVVEVVVGVRNPNPFALPAGRLGYGLFLSDREIARTDATIERPIALGEEALVAVPIRISVFKAGTAVARMLLPFASLDIALRGQAVFDGVPVPLDLASSLVPGL